MAKGQCKPEEKKRRLAAVALCLIKGEEYRALVDRYQEEWGVGKSTVEHYITEARKQSISLTTRDNRGERWVYHMEAREKLLQIALKADKPSPYVILNILQDMARLEGLYIDKVQISDDRDFDSGDIIIK